IDGIGGVVSQEVNAVASDADVVGKADDRHPCPACDGRDGANIVGKQRPENELVAIADRLLRIRSDSAVRSEEHTSELQSLMRHSYAVFCLKKKDNNSTQ